MAAASADTELVGGPGAGHAAHLEAPGAVADAILSTSR
jgi:pimeloyl-ACP methyl ester carboxylesterase